MVQILSACPDETLRELGQRRAALVLLVHEVPSLELVLEGVDPRISALSLATRGGSDDEPPELTGLAIYRRNLVRLARSAEQFDHELRFAVLEELANFFQLSDARRERLGLPPLAADLDYVDDEPAPHPARPRRRRARSASPASPQEEAHALLRCAARDSAAREDAPTLRPRVMASQ
ncbi:metallopeptidase family protein [Nannocystis pusilla]|uniref:metallopeptidase family protein n=1 Tax=Nannocystis pusilla TaxID=889268 RepID=UPI003B7AE762